MMSKRDIMMSEIKGITCPKHNKKVDINGKCKKCDWTFTPNDIKEIINKLDKIMGMKSTKVWHHHGQPEYLWYRRKWVIEYHTKMVKCIFDIYRYDNETIIKTYQTYIVGNFLTEVCKVKIDVDRELSVDFIN